jgi:hypothetical protein
MTTISSANPRRRGRNRRHSLQRTKPRRLQQMSLQQTHLAVTQDEKAETSPPQNGARGYYGLEGARKNRPGVPPDGFLRVSRLCAGREAGRYMFKFVASRDGDLLGAVTVNWRPPISTRRLRLNSSLSSLQSASAPLGRHQHGLAHRQAPRQQGCESGTGIRTCSKQSEARPGVSKGSFVCSIQAGPFTALTSSSPFGPFS